MTCQSCQSKEPIYEAGCPGCEARAVKCLKEGEIMKWLPIETAPKDGTDVLLYGVWAGEINGIDPSPKADIGCWRGGRSDYGSEGWWSLSTGDAYSCWMTPTHWMPLPSAPNVEVAC